MPDFSIEQLDAIHARGTNLLVCAAAGSGKTAVLVERIVVLLQEGASLENMLIVTYTRAAAAEMRDRIMNRLQKEENSKHLREQMALLPRAQIKTLHSFCAWLLKSYFLEADLSPAFGVDSGAGLHGMQKRAMDDALDHCLSSPENIALLSRLCKVSQLPDTIKKVCEFMLCQVDPDAWVTFAISQYQSMCKDYPASPHAAVQKEQRESLLCAAEERLHKAIALCALPEGPCQYLPTLQEDFHVINALRAGSLIKFTSLSSKKPKDRNVDPAIQSTVKKLRDDSKAFVVDAQDTLAPDLYSITHMEEMLPCIECLFTLCKDYLARYEAARISANRLSYSDLEHRALRALKDPQVAKALQEQFSYVFIDEYQDSNGIQETILRSIARQDSRFMVGDVKQSIYRFRMADPTIFLATQEAFAHGKGGRRIDLNRNYRSIPSILHAVNHVFARVMVGGTSKITYDALAHLYPGRTDGIDVPVDILLLRSQNTRGEDLDELESIEAEEIVEIEPSAEQEKLSDAEREAILVAQSIVSLLGTPIKDKDGMRVVRAGDIAILLRAQSNMLLFQRALEAQGISVMLEAGGALLGTPEVRCLLDLLRSIDNRRLDLPLLASMRYFGGFSLQELALVRKYAPREPFANAAFACIDAQEPIAKRVKAYLLQLLVWRKQARTMPLTDFIDALLEQTNYERIQSLRPRGAARVQNIRALSGLANRMQGATLGDFIEAATLMQSTGKGEDAARLPAEDQDAVRIMTIHKSKGLEFPIVFGCNLHKKFNMRDTRDSLLLHNELGFATQWVDSEISTQQSTPAREAIAQRIRTESIAEEARVLYVLMTRARERLYLSACVDSLERVAARWADIAPGIAEAKNMLDMLGPALMHHADGAMLGETLAYPQSIATHPARYTLQYIKEITPPTEQETTSSLYTTMQLETQRAGQDVPTSLAEQLSYQPQTKTGTKSQKTSVTASLREIVKQEIPPSLPNFLEGEVKAPAAQRGLAMHSVLRALDLARLRSVSPSLHTAVPSLLRKEIDQQIDEMREHRLLTKSQAAQIPTDAIVSFFTSELGQAALASETVLREQPFNLRVQDGEDLRLMQGIIDLCYLNAQGTWNLIDYKTDRYDLAPAQIIERHGEQLRMYALALASLTPAKVARKVVYLFATGQAIDV